MQMLLPRSGAVKDGVRRVEWTNMASVECRDARPDPQPEVRVTPQKRATKRRGGGRRATAPRARRAAEAPPLEPIVAPVEEALAGPLEETPLPPDLATIEVEPVFAGRMPPPEPGGPPPPPPPPPFSAAGTPTPPAPPPRRATPLPGPGSVSRRARPGA